MKKHIIAPLLLCCLTLSAWADTLQLREDRPDRYVVVKGDTLWDISARFLKDPWQWPKVWKMNRAQIKNPHLIYPGDVIMLALCDGEPCLRLLSEEVRLQPGVRIEPLAKEAVPAIAPGVIAPFLEQPLVIEADALKSAPKVLAAEDGRLLLAPGINVYASNITEDDAPDWQIYRPGQEFIDPDSNEKLGTEAIYLGDARTLRAGEPGTVRITRMKQDVNAGDRMTHPDIKPINAFIPHAPDNEVTGRILSVYGGSYEAGRNSVVAISRGTADGLEEGHVLAIYRQGNTLPAEKPEAKEREGYINLERNEDGTLKRDEQGRVQVRTGTRPADGSPEPELKPIQLPDERIGLLMVFRTFERVSYGLIMQSERSINPKDIVTNP